MSRLGAWLPIAANRLIVPRALATSIVVGTILTLVNRGSEISGGTLTADAIGPIALTYVTPYLVATLSSSATVRPGQVTPITEPKK